MISVKAIVRDTGWREIQRLAKELSKKKPYVKIGVLGNAKDHRDGEGITNVELALIQEFGSPKNSIPARSFIRAPFHAKRKEYVAMLAKLLGSTLTKKGMPVEKALAIMGEKIAADFKKSAPGTPPPNAPSVLKRKEAKGNASGPPKTLVDTGRMVDSISYEVVTE